MEILRRALFRNSVVGLHVRSRLACLSKNEYSTATPPSRSTDQEVLKTVRPYSEIPTPKTFLSVSWDLIRDPKRLADNLEKRTKVLGKIFKEKGIPSLPEMVFILDPKDVEKVYRTGDRGYPSRVTISEWIQVHAELKLPIGMFLE